MTVFARIPLLIHQARVSFQFYYFIWQMCRKCGDAALRRAKVSYPPRRQTLADASFSFFLYTKKQTVLMWRRQKGVYR